ncbi:carboxypeptidase-like regulatory domain-containing protein [Aquibacillus saliphilus]|uniref:carboxypeptidase-like regulatory domain-containing protein n=1 Tax=Aquibacillus saliphilus TaxID=1909422 RepID=UPI001CEFDBA3|nr:carboxypeptidase-like regulatory domain-containing protein [Aquibacillus saliphilus]
MKVKMKVKHLLWIIVTLTLMVVGITQWLIPTIQMEVAQRSAGDSFQEKDHYIELLESGDLPDYKKKDLIEEHLIFFGYENAYDIEAGPAMTSGPSIPLHSTRINYIEWYVENTSERDQFYFQAINQLAYGYAKQGKFDEAQQLLSEIIEEMNSMDTDYWNLYKTKTEILSVTNPAQAIIDINEAMEYSQLTTEFIELKANILTNMEDYQQAIDTINTTRENSSHSGKLKKRLEGWQDGENLHKVQGRFATSDGDPVSFAKVYLRLPETINHSIRPEEEIHYAITDANGNFTIGGVPDGNYQLFIGIDIGQMNGYKWVVEPDDWLHVDSNTTENITLQPLISINSPSNYQEFDDDQILFDWDSVEGAAYYQLGFGIEYDNGSSSSIIDGRFEESEVTLPVERIYAQSAGISYDTNENDELEVIPESLLAFANTNNDLFWYVEAFTEEGDLITSSLGFRLTRESMGEVPFFELKQRELTKADNLLLDGKINQAFDQYKLVLERDGDNLHALRMVERIILYGESARLSDETRQKALPYTKRLAVLSEQFDDASYWFRLAHYAFSIGDWDNYFSYYQNGSDIQNGPVYDYDKSYYAMALMKNGRLDEAEILFEEIIESDGNNRFMPAWTALKLFRTENFDVAEQLAKKYPIIADYGYSEWSSLIERMKDQVEQSSVAKREFDRGLELYMSGQEREFNQWLEEEPEESIKRYFEELSQL